MIVVNVVVSVVAIDHETNIIEGCHSVHQSLVVQRYFSSETLVTVNKVMF